MTLTLRGLTKIMARPVKRAQPLTPEILMDIVAFLNLSKRTDLVFWGILVIGFFAMLRKSNLMPDSRDSFDPVKQLTRGHVKFRQNIAIISVTWAKNLQNRERLLEIPLFEVKDSLLCPVTVLKALLKKEGRSSYPLFGSGKQVSFTYNQFQNKFRKVLNKAGYKSGAFSSHSIRRGAAIWASRNGVSENLLQIHGDWASDAYKNYLHFPLEIRAVVALKMREGIEKCGY